MDPKLYAANKFEALKSTGPRTPEGKRRSSLNSTRHSLTGQIVIFTPEEGVVFEKHCKGWRESLAPVGFREGELAQSIAEDHYRLKRARALENSTFAQGQQDHADDVDFGNPEVNSALAQANTWKEQAKNLHLLTIYEQRINRTLEKNTAKLEALQYTRKAAYDKAEEEAILLAEEAQIKGETYDPAPDFPPHKYVGYFVFESSEIARLISRSKRLEDARNRKAAAAFALIPVKPGPRPMQSAS
jgi:hypothetical protein